MHCDDHGVIAHLLNKIIMSASCYSGPDGSFRVTTQIHIPMPGEIVKTRHCILEQSEINDMHCIIGQHSM